MSTDRRRYKILKQSEVEIILEKAIEGDEMALSDLYQAFMPYLYTVCRTKYTQMSDEDVEDEVLLFMAKIFTRYLGSYDKTKSKFKTWLTFGFKRHLLNIPDRKKRVKTTSIEALFPDDDDNIRGEESKHLRDVDSNFKKFGETLSFYSLSKLIINLIGPKLGRIIIYRHYYGMLAQEVERKMNVPRGTYKYYERKAFSKLSKVLRKSDYID